MTEAPRRESRINPSQGAVWLGGSRSGPRAIPRLPQGSSNKGLQPEGPKGLRGSPEPRISKTPGTIGGEGQGGHALFRAHMGGESPLRGNSPDTIERSKVATGLHQYDPNGMSQPSPSPKVEGTRPLTRLMQAQTLPHSGARPSFQSLVDQDQPSPIGSGCSGWIGAI